MKLYARKIREFDNKKDLQRGMASNLRSEGRPVVAAVRAAALGVQVSSTKGGGARTTGLRARVAAATRVVANTRGVVIYVSASAVGPYGHTLPRYLDAESPGYELWRHPVFGHKTRWSSQIGEPFFYSTIRKREHLFRSAVTDAVDDALKKLE